jgi:hypothetical protein
LYTSHVGFLFDLFIQVMHSQRLSELPLKAWAILSSAGEVKAAHCTCMAGIAETCTHVGALLFKAEATVRCRERTTVTGVAAYWVIPSNVDKVQAQVGVLIVLVSHCASSACVQTQPYSVSAYLTFCLHFHMPMCCKF